VEGCCAIPQQVAKRYLVGCRKAVTLRRKTLFHVDTWQERSLMPVWNLRNLQKRQKKSAEWRRNGIFFFPLVQGFHKALFLNIFLSFILADRKVVDFQ
jgi:hypothetical protein